MGIASEWKIWNCLTVIPRLHISSQRQRDLLQEYLISSTFWRSMQKLCNHVSQNFIDLPQVQSKCLENCLTSNSNWILSAFKLIETIQRWKMPNYAQAAISVRQKKERDLEKPHQQVPVKTRSKKENRKVVNPHCLVEACFTMLQHYSSALQRKKL